MSTFTARGWIAVVVDPYGFVRAHTFANLAELADDLSAAEVIAVDIPIGISNDYPRPADIITASVSMDVGHPPAEIAKSIHAAT